MTECTNIDCGNESDLYLCRQCISDLQQWIDKGRALIPDMTATIYRLDNVRQAPTGGGGGLVTGSKPPIDLAALELRDWLTRMHDSTTYAADQMAAGWAWEIQDNVRRAERMVSGPEPEGVDHAAIREKVENIAPPMPTRQLLPFLREKAGIVLTSQHIRDWARRGHLRPVERDPQPTYHPHEVIAAWHRKEAS
ncbi:hypothetical protein [Arthrobacter sp. USHLN218]|uniref:hypothetical protein n=1 Tax=Arthrobacter sp. USHLN218 TaxID=3081232 RepID=UPI00301645A5